MTVPCDAAGRAVRSEAPWGVAAWMRPGALRSVGCWLLLTTTVAGSPARADLITITLRSGHEAQCYRPATSPGSPRLPLVIALHGAGGRPSDALAPWQPLAEEQGFLVLAPAGSMPEAYGFTWPYAPTGVEQDLKRWIRYMARHYRADRKRVLLSGFSMGGYHTFHVGLRNPRLFRGLVPIGAVYEPVVVKPYLRRYGGKRVPPVKVYIMMGALDSGLPSARSAEAALRQAAIPVIFKEFPDLGHAPPPNLPEELRQALAWIGFP